MADDWYFTRGGETHGPLSAVQLREEAVAGRLGRDDAVWKDGMQKRVLAVKVQHLFTGVPEGPPALVEEPALPSLEAAVGEAPGSLDDMPDDPKLVPLDDAPMLAPQAAAEEEPAQKPAPPRHSGEVRKRRVTRVTGAVLTSQDGAVMRFKKKCVKCAHEDTSLTTLQIPSGSMRMSYFCPKCRKNQPIEISGV
jgi:DNA-directed RNA polymerase subunit M/transcription elongation factor TFIIS